MIILAARVRLRKTLARESLRSGSFDLLGAGGRCLILIPLFRLNSLPDEPISLSFCVLTVVGGMLALRLNPFLALLDGAILAADGIITQTESDDIQRLIDYRKLSSRFHSPLLRRWQELSIVPCPRALS